MKAVYRPSRCGGPVTVATLLVTLVWITGELPRWYCRKSTEPPRTPNTDKGEFKNLWFFLETAVKFEQTGRAGPENGRCGGCFAAGTILIGYVWGRNHWFRTEAHQERGIIK